MYYDNKQTFYVKQYGPAVIISVVSLILIASGIFLYLQSSNIGNPFAKNNEIAQTLDTNAANTNTVENTSDITAKTEEPVKVENSVVENNALVEEPKTNVEVIKYFEKLDALKKSIEVSVTDISTSGTVTVEVNGDKLVITLIGVDFKYSQDAAIEKMKTDLLNKKVKIAFDVFRSENDKTFAYIYNGESLYNADLLKTGLVTLKTERKNIKLNSQLASAQTYARDNSLGVWKK